MTSTIRPSITTVNSDSPNSSNSNSTSPVIVSANTRASGSTSSPVVTCPTGTHSDTAISLNHSPATSVSPIDAVNAAATAVKSMLKGFSVKDILDLPASNCTNNSSKEHVNSSSSSSSPATSNNNNNNNLTSAASSFSKSLAASLAATHSLHNSTNALHHALHSAAAASLLNPVTFFTSRNSNSSSNINSGNSSLRSNHINSLRPLDSTAGFYDSILSSYGAPTSTSHHHPHRNWLNSANGQIHSSANSTSNSMAPPTNVPSSDLFPCKLTAMLNVSSSFLFLFLS